jgi:creatinine amidohydrolase/Fe(II)-dependent formamide hydrolase-like protein
VIDAHDTVFLEEMTWLEVRDALRAGTRTVIVATGGIEMNGPYVALGKHNYVLAEACDGIARQLGNALCAPIIKLVPEGNIDEPSGHMRYPGTISLREETFRQVLDDVASSLKAHGFQNIVFIGDSGGNQGGMEAVAASLNERWTDASAHFIPEFYEYEKVFDYMASDLGIEEPTNDGIHDDFVITSIMMVHDPATVRHSQRVSAGKATINGLSIEDADATIEVGQKLLQYRVDQTVKAIEAAIGSRD